MTLDRRLYFPLVVVFAGVLAAQEALNNATTKPVVEVIQLTSSLRSTQMSTVPSTPVPPANVSTESASIATSSLPAQSTKAPRRHHEVSFSSRDDQLDSGSDDWDYMEDLIDSSSKLRKLMKQELDRHRQDDPRARRPTNAPPITVATHRSASHAHGRNAHAHAHIRPLPAFTRAFTPTWTLGWPEFCEEAAAEDEEPFRVSDGSFHPKFEEVPGVGVYRLHARPRSWEEARKVCEREGAQLAVPNSRTEALALMEIHNRCPRLLSSHFNDYQYLGVHDLYSEGDWETVVGDPLNETGYMVWGRNQPDNAHHHGENCLSMNRNGFFNDVPCWTELPFICEHP